jgi:adenine-specific DNA-methyltransferase
MNLRILTPKQSLNKAYLKEKISRTDIELFKNNFGDLTAKINDKGDEEHLKSLIADFLKLTYYNTSQHQINPIGKNDLVIHTGKTPADPYGVILEVKSPVNKAEMITAAKPNAKALHELILYYLDERITRNRNELKQLIITNIYDWFMIDANEFDKKIYRNTGIKKLYDLKKSDNKDNPWFYNELKKLLESSPDLYIDTTFFDLRDYKKIITNTNPHDDKGLIALYKILSPVHLLKLPFANDSNTLQPKFYSELLHIIGLFEYKEGSKKLIDRKKEGERNAGSLLENVIVQLDSHDKISRLDRPSQYGDTHAFRLYNVALELVITWINRILFLKLLEAQLINYHKGDKSFTFLNKDKIGDFDDLDKLFFRVLAKRGNEREANIQKLFDKVPYLNSSLFEPTELEHLTVFISGLENNISLPVISSTVLKDGRGKALNGTLNTLDYLFAFLNAYDFSSEGAEEIQEDNKQLINASVLGLIFEKINGYKDGSFFTPGFITMYMCRETIRRAVVQKFNEAKGWDCKEYTELYNLITDKKEANKLINSLKICDPAVGSGHFLVSALNEMIAIKSDLQVLTDKDGRTLRDYGIEVVNDELIITDANGDIFEYNPSSKESQRIQETLFHEKQTIIENCLFGVDINPNSVKICRLRLWIELLKNAYYKTGTGELETLPNIDINIKIGNSLISRFALDADLKQALRDANWNINVYRIAVSTYKNATDKEAKRDLLNLINKIKNAFKATIGSKQILELKKLESDFYTEYERTRLFEIELDKDKKSKIESRKKKAISKIQEKTQEIEEIKNNRIYQNAFEWRFEFPEVLNDEGDFVGFDVVIGNPPYIRQEEVKTQSNYFENVFRSYSGKSDIYVFFYEKGLNILQKNGILNFITSGKFLEANYGKTLVDHLLNETILTTLINFNDLEVFEGVSAYPLILNCIKKQENDFDFHYYNLKDLPTNTLSEHLEKIIPLRISKHTFILNDYKFVIDAVSRILNKIKQNSITVEEFCGLPIVGIKTGFNDGYLTTLSNSKFIKPYVFGRDIKKYQPVRSNNRIIFPYNDDFSIANLNSEQEIMSSLKKEKDRLSSRAIIKEGLVSGNKCWYEYQQINKSLNYDDEYIVYPNVSFGNNFTLSKGIIIDMTAFLIKSNSRYLLAILNSSLTAYLMKIWSISRRGGYLEYKVQYIEKIPIKNISIKDQQPFVDLVNRIISCKNELLDSRAYEDEIDQLVYKLYGLTEEEIKIVEGIV